LQLWITIEQKLQRIIVAFKDIRLWNSILASFYAFEAVLKMCMKIHFTRKKKNDAKENDEVRATRSEKTLLISMEEEERKPL